MCGVLAQGWVILNHAVLLLTRITEVLSEDIAERWPPGSAAAQFRNFVLI